MGFRRETNRHELWALWCATGKDLLAGLPQETYRTEKGFRTLATDGALPSAELNLAEFSDDQIEALWEFAHYSTQLDMDSSTFEALNARFRTIRQKRRTAG